MRKIKKVIEILLQKVAVLEQKELTFPNENR